MSRYVVKLGGHALDSLAPSNAVLAALAEDVAALEADVVLVHGGGPQIQTLLERVGLPSRFEDGLRVTDEATMDCVAMALCHVNVLLVAALRRAGLAGVGLSGVDGLLRSTSLGEPWGRAGATPHVDLGVLEVLFAAGLTPVVSPLAVDEAGELLNCNADVAAGAIAGAMDADVLVLLSDVAQVRADLEDASSVLDVLSERDARRLLADGGARDGMRPKLQAALDALTGGARRVVVANGTTPHAFARVLEGSLAKTELVR